MEAAPGSDTPGSSNSAGGGVHGSGSARCPVTLAQRAQGSSSLWPGEELCAEAGRSPKGMNLPESLLDEQASVEAGRTQEGGCRIAWLLQFLVRECGGPVGAGHRLGVAAQLLWRSGRCQAQEFEVTMICDVTALHTG